MPWASGAEFARKHFKKSTSAQAERARRIAEAIIAGGGDEGVAIATGIAKAKERRGKR